MQRSHVEAIIQGLNAAQVRYLLAGGLAVVAYGYLRFTADVDLIIALDRENVLSAMSVLKKLGYSPRIPVRPEDFADAALRESWIRDKGLMVFSMFNPQAEDTIVDLFVSIPFDFGKEYQSAETLEIMGGQKAPVVSLDQLIKMKTGTGRPKDEADAEYLKNIKKLRNES